MKKNLIHLDYDINKKKYRDIFFDNIQKGQWHWMVPKKQDPFWYQLFIRDDSELKPLFADIEKELNIFGMNNFPRFSYQFRDTRLEPHTDEDKMVSININLFDTTPIIHIEGEPYKYECAFIDVGHCMHSVEPDPNDRLILKFCLRHPWEEVYKRLDERGLLDVR